MRRVLFTLICGCLPLAAADSPSQVVQQLFNAMAAHDAKAAQPLFTPGAMLYSVRADGTTSATPFEQFVKHIGAGKDAWLERTYDAYVLVHGTIAVYWANYDFLLNGKLHHCGVDSFSLLRTASGWKIAAVSDTRETNCKAR